MNIVDEFCDKLEKGLLEMEQDLLNSSLREHYKGLDAIQKLARIVTTKKYQSSANQILQSSRCKRIAEKLQRVYEDYDILWETHVCLKLLQSSARGEKIDFGNSVNSLWPEADILGLSRDSKVVFVGCGPFPATAISWAKNFGCHVTCLEYNPVSASMSSALVKAVGLEKNMHVVCVNAATFDYGSATHIALAVMTHGKAGVIAQIRKTLPKSSLLTVRAKEGLKACMFPGWEISDLKGFEVIGKVRTHKMYDSLLLVPKK